MAKYYISTGTLELFSQQTWSLMMLAEELYMVHPDDEVDDICIVMSVGTGIILLLTQPRM